MAGGQLRGPYAKGLAKREQLLTEALAAYGESEGEPPSLKTISARVGLSERGLLHYFGSRNALFTQILAERDRRLREAYDPSAPAEEVLTAVARQAETPGLGRLYVEMAATSVRGTPSHAFFERHFHELTADIVRMLDAPVDEESRAGATADRNEFVARVLIAAADGLQLRQLSDESIDLPSDLLRLLQVMRAALAGADADI